MIEGDQYTYQIIIPSDSTEVLHYIFHSNDTSENLATSTRVDANIFDNDQPFFNDNSSDNSTTGAQFNFDLTAGDNVELNRIIVTWSHGGLGGTDVEMIDDRDGTWSLRIELDESTMDMTYTISIFDAAGNSYMGPQISVQVRDTTLPRVEPKNDITIYSGMMIEIDIDASDNIGVEEVKWDGLPLNFYGIEFKGYVNQSGTYPVTVTVKDKALNSADIKFTITVLPRNNDDDLDGIPDLIEAQYGLDPLDPSDGSMDHDNDGLTNLEEYRNGTDPKNHDTDGDGIWDGWEIKYGLNPLADSAEDDEDGDGKTNLEEFTYKTDPTKKPKKSGFNYLWGLLTTPIVLILIGAIVAWVFIRKRRKIIKLLGPADPSGVKDIFISYAHKDRNTAYSICNKLEEMDLRCWIAPRDVTPGVPWGKAIITAINSARIMILIFSADSNESEQVLREVERAVNKKIPIILFRITDISPSEELEYYISAIHWLDATDEPLEEHIEELARTVQQTLEAEIVRLEPRDKKELLPKNENRPSLPPKTSQEPIPEAEPIQPMEQSEPPKEV
jgi:hypothetical protein